MKTEEKRHIHKKPEYGKRTFVFGHLLEAGDILQEGDVYDSSSGGWEPCPCPGLILQEGITTVWVRPSVS